MKCPGKAEARRATRELGSLLQQAILLLTKLTMLMGAASATLQLVYGNTADGRLVSNPSIKHSDSSQQSPAVWAGPESASECGCAVDGSHATPRNASPRSACCAPSLPACTTVCQEHRSECGAVDSSQVAPEQETCHGQH